ncbi:MAG TPA: sulfotransferase domain-containing protein [Rhabdochlamydiaceae bacterium]|jgi:hypothetical protein
MKGFLNAVVYGFCALSCSGMLHAEPEKEISFLARADAPQATGLHFFLSYARSGTNLTSCYLQYLTQKPIKFLFDESTFLAENRLRTPLDYTKPVLYRTHFPKDLTRINPQKNKLLYILRNCKESILRHNYQMFESPEEYRDLFKKNHVIVREYMEALQLYDKWAPSMRLLVHYEDLLTDPMTVVKQILEFFDEPVPENLTPELLKEISDKTLASYNKQHKAISGGSHSKGQDLLYHTKNLPPHILQDIDVFLQTNYPILWQNYLYRYKS